MIKSIFLKNIPCFIFATLILGAATVQAMELEDKDLEDEAVAHPAPFRFYKEEGTATSFCLEGEYKETQEEKIQITRAMKTFEKELKGFPSGAFKGIDLVMSPEGGCGKKLFRDLVEFFPATIEGVTFQKSVDFGEIDPKGKGMQLLKDKFGATLTAFKLQSNGPSFVFHLYPSHIKALGGFEALGVLDLSNSRGLAGNTRVLGTLLAAGRLVRLDVSSTKMNDGDVRCICEGFQEEKDDGIFDSMSLKYLSLSYNEGVTPASSDDLAVIINETMPPADSGEKTTVYLMGTGYTEQDQRELFEKKTPGKVTCFGFQKVAGSAK